MELPPPDVRDPGEWNFTDQLGPPDLIVPSIPIDIPASGNDIWHKHMVPERPRRKPLHPGGSSKTPG